MKKIPLTQGKFAVVDDIDYVFLMQWKWYVNSNGYAVRHAYKSEQIDNKSQTILMHRVILTRVLKRTDFPECDHKNGNRLDNCQSNLRPASHRQNRRNSKSRSGSSSKFNGVFWYKRDQKWRAQCVHKHLGYFDNELDAAKAYNKAAIKHFGEFACLNVID